MSSTWTAGSDGKGPRRGRWPSRARSPSSGVRIRIDGDVMMPVCRVRNPLVKSCVSAGKSRLDQERGNSCNSHSNDTAHVHGPVPKIRWTTPAIDAPSRRKHNRCASGWQLGVPSICPAVVQRAQLSSSPLSMIDCAQASQPRRPSQAAGHFRVQRQSFPLYVHEYGYRSRRRWSRPFPNLARRPGGAQLLSPTGAVGEQWMNA